jgi:flagellar biosynthesis repressor protein FlbT
MTGLVLKLGPKERIMINGVVMENGDRRTRLNVISPEAHVLRLRDAIHPEEVNTPVTRVCYIAQLVLAGETSADDAKPQLLRGIEQLRFVFNDTNSRDLLADAAEAVQRHKYYPALKALRLLMTRERQLLARVEARVS